MLMMHKSLLLDYSCDDRGAHVYESPIGPWYHDHLSVVRHHCLEINAGLPDGDYADELPYLDGLVLRPACCLPRHRMGLRPSRQRW